MAKHSMTISRIHEMHSDYCSPWFHHLDIQSFIVAQMRLKNVFLLSAPIVVSLKNEAIKVTDRCQKASLWAFANPCDEPSTHNMRSLRCFSVESHTNTLEAITLYVCDRKSMGGHKSVKSVESIMFSSLFWHSARCSLQLHSCYSRTLHCADPLAT